MYEFGTELGCFFLGVVIGFVSLKNLIRNGKSDYLAIHEAFFPSLYDCRICLKDNKLCKNEICGLSKLRKLTAILETATNDIDICVCLITLIPIATILARLANNGVNIRILCDGTQMKHGTFGRETRNLLKGENIEMKEVLSGYLMHHKFAIIDSKILINGSMNWTLNGFFLNYENLEITNKKDAVAAFKREFSDLWILVG